jgi:hypothetical protein
VLTLDVSKGSAGFLNGRRPQDDVIDIVLQAASKGAIAGDGVNANDVPFLSDFPFFAPAHDPTKPIPAREKTGNLDSSLDPSHGSNLIREASPLGLPDTLSRAPLRRRAPFAWLTRGRSFADAGEIRSQSHRPPRPL